MEITTFYKLQVQEETKNPDEESNPSDLDISDESESSYSSVSDMSYTKSNKDKG